MEWDGRVPGSADIEIWASYSQQGQRCLAQRGAMPEISSSAKVRTTKKGCRPNPMRAHARPDFRATPAPAFRSLVSTWRSKEETPITLGCPAGGLLGSFSLGPLVPPSAVRTQGPYPPPPKVGDVVDRPRSRVRPRRPRGDRGRARGRGEWLRCRRAKAPSGSRSRGRQEAQPRPWAQRRSEERRDDGV